MRKEKVEEMLLKFCKYNVACNEGCDMCKAAFRAALLNTDMSEQKVTSTNK